MKKFIAVILASLYLFTSAGATVNLHYCMGKLTEKSADGNVAMMCNKCKTKEDQKKGDCCKNKTVQIKAESDHNLPDFSFNTIHFFSITLPVAFIEVPSGLETSTSTEQNALYPLWIRSSQTSIYKLNGVFRI